MLNPSMLLELFYSPHSVYDGILKYNFSKFCCFFLLRYQCVLNMDGARCYILNSVGTKLNHNKDKRHVRPITCSQTVQAQTCTDRLGQETNSKFCLRNTALFVVCRTAL
jgi:hypothetical protein